MNDERLDLRRIRHSLFRDVPRKTSNLQVGAHNGPKVALDDYESTVGRRHGLRQRMVAE